MSEPITWGDESLTVTIATDDEGRARLVRFGASDAPAIAFSSALPLVEIVTVSDSKTTGTRYDATTLGLDLRLTGQRAFTDGEHEVLELELHSPAASAATSTEASAVTAAPTSLAATVSYRRRPGSGVLSSSVRLRNTDADAGITVLFVSGFALGDGAWDVAGTDIRLADSTWLAESRWRRGTFEQLGQPDVAMAAHGGAAPRGALTLTGRGTWSTGEHLPMGALERPDGTTLLWQVESNGGWLWQLARSPGASADGVLRLVTSGPTDAEHNAAIVLSPTDTFTTPTTTLAWSARGFEHAVELLTDHRRADRRPYAGDAALPVIYNDYMDTLMADPTTQKLLPLISAVGRTGAEIFVVDAGWYSDEPGWWDTVGVWQPSTTRFAPDGLGAIFDAIRAEGMIPGLWLEPEVVGVRSPAVHGLPDEAFFLRNGQRVVDNGRYQLDYRHPTVVSRMDAVIDRLVRDFGIGYVKFDYNIDPVWGTDVNASSPGQGILAAQRAFLDWVDGLHARHPQLIIEDCSSGGMRGDWLTVSHFALLSTSDQQDAVRCAPIGVASSLLVPPEQAGVWSYPQGGMPAGVAVTTLANSLLRRPILSGHIDHLDETELARVQAFVAAHKRIRASLPQLHSSWPLGLPGWDDAWLAAALVGDDEAYLAVWRRDAASPDSITVPLAGPVAEAVAQPVAVEQIFPNEEPVTWSVEDGVLHVALPAPYAVVFRLAQS